jgi:hypothetical protein
MGLLSAISIASSVTDEFENVVDDYARDDLVNSKLEDTDEDVVSQFLEAYDESKDMDEAVEDDADAEKSEAAAVVSDDTELVQDPLAFCNSCIAKRHIVCFARGRPRCMLVNQFGNCRLKLHGTVISNQDACAQQFQPQEWDLEYDY